MDYKKLVSLLLIGILIISNYFMLYGKSYLGEYVIVFAMTAILSGLSLIVVVIISRKERIKEIYKQSDEFNILYEKAIELKVCNICQTENTAVATFCKNCGSDLKDVLCPVCRKVNQYDQKYCEECGTVLRNERRH